MLRLSFMQLDPLRDKIKTEQRCEHYDAVVKYVLWQRDFER